MPLSTTSSIRPGRRTDLQLTFFLPSSDEGLNQLFCRLTLNGRVTEPYASGVYLFSQPWLESYQQASGGSAESQAINQALSDIRAEHRRLLRDLLSTGHEPSADSLRRQWLTGEAVMPTLLQIYDDYLRFQDELPLPERKSESSTFKWYKAYRYLREYLHYTNQPNLLLTEVTRAWARRYILWLRKVPLSLDTAARYFGYVRAALQHAVDQGLLVANPLWGMEIKREAAKPIECLSSEQLQELVSCELSPRLDNYRQWALLCCYTGLDYQDAVQVVHCQKECIIATPHGEKIVWRRQKIATLMATQPHDGVCHIPVLPEARILLDQAIEWPIPTLQRVNSNLRIIQKRIDLPFRLTTKTCRKTAGAVFLLRGYRVEVVQKILGHKNFITLQRNYIKLMGELVDENMRSISKKEV